MRTDAQHRGEPDVRRKWRMVAAGHLGNPIPLPIVILRALYGIAHRLLARMAFSHRAGKAVGSPQPARLAASRTSAGSGPWPRRQRSRSRSVRRARFEMKSLDASGEGCSAASARTQFRHCVEQKSPLESRLPFLRDPGIVSSRLPSSSPRQNEQRDRFTLGLLALPPAAVLTTNACVSPCESICAPCASFSCTVTVSSCALA